MIIKLLPNSGEKLTRMSTLLNLIKDMVERETEYTVESIDYNLAEIVLKRTKMLPFPKSLLR